MTVDTVIEDGTLITSDGSIVASVALDDGIIAAVGQEHALPEADETVDASGQFIMPGVVDPHVHIDDMFSVDTYETATSAAAVGGVTTYIRYFPAVA